MRTTPSIEARRHRHAASSEVVDPVAAIVRQLDQPSRPARGGCLRTTRCVPASRIPDSDGSTWVAAWDVAFRVAASSTDRSRPPEMMSAALRSSTPKETCRSHSPSGKPWAVRFLTFVSRRTAGRHEPG